MACFLDSVTIDAVHPASLARFWAAALSSSGYAVRAYDEAEVARLAGLGFTPETDPTVMVDGPTGSPTLCFQKVATGPATGRNRLHLDLRAASSTSRRAEVTRLVELGACIRDERESWTTMLDPEGNPFCMQDPRAATEGSVAGAEGVARRSHAAAGASVVIQRLGAEDGDRWKAIRLRSLKADPAAFGSVYDDAVDRSTEEWSAQLNSGPACLVAVRTLGDTREDIGVVRWAVDDDVSTVDAVGAMLLSMWVAPDARGAGVGDMLIEAAATAARENGVQRIVLDVTDDNAPAIALYERHGFVANGVVGRMDPPREHVTEHQRERWL